MFDIAICEDNPIHANLLKEKVSALLQMPFRIHTFLSGNEFLENCNENLQTMT